MDYLRLDNDLRFKQSGRQARYLQVADDLVARGRAIRQDGAVFLSHALRVQGFDDQALGRIKATAQDVDFVSHMVLIKSDGMPTYHFASVVDDIDHDINFVIRGNDHTNNTIKQLALYDALDAPAPRYAHIGLLCDLATGKKLSKSDGAKSLLDFRDDGVDADAMCNFLLRLGWGPKCDDKSTAVLPRDRALALFLSAGNLRGAASKVDFTKLVALDRKYKARALAH
jgi:glutamyl-tRNA synthetase